MREDASSGFGLTWISEGRWRQLLIENESTITNVIKVYNNSNSNNSNYDLCIFDQSIWECNGHFEHLFSNIKALLCGIWNFAGRNFILQVHLI